MSTQTDYRAKYQITEALIHSIFSKVVPGRKLDKDKIVKGFVYTFNKYADYFGIDTKLETVHFISQVAHECDYFNTFEEYASGKAYEGRQDLGNIFAGDGVRFKGKGAIQTTGRVNTQKAGREILKLPFLNDTERKTFENDGLLKNSQLLKDPVWGTLAAFIYWVDKDLNPLCLAPEQKVTIKRFNGIKWYNYTCGSIEALTRKINGGMNGYDERVKNFHKIFNKL